MDHQNDIVNDADAKRRLQAESLLENDAHVVEELKHLSPVAIAELFHELTVHQIELELQNEELRLAQLELDRAKSRYFDLYDLAPVGYLTVNTEDLITEANLVAANLLGLARRDVLMKRFSSYIVNEDLELFYSFRTQLFESQEAQSQNLRLLNVQNQRFWVRMEAVVSQDIDHERVLRITLSNINELINSQTALAESNQFNHDVLNAISVQIAVLNGLGILLATNKAWQNFVLETGQVSGLVIKPVAIGSHYLEACELGFQKGVFVEYQDAYQGLLRVLKAELPYFSVEYAAQVQGQTRWFMMTATPFDIKQGGGVVISHTDISARKLAEADLRIAAVAFETQEGMMVTDAGSEILRINSAYTDITGYTTADVLGKTPRIFSSGRHTADFYKVMWATIKAKGVWVGEICNQRKNKELYPARLSITQVTDTDNIVTNYVSTLIDMTETKSAQDKIHRLAFYDPLTNLPNRRLLYDLLKPALAASKRSGRKGALLFIDLDDFKTLNDTLGHDMGDLLLMQVATRLLFCVRECDTVARLGGDEFVVMLDNLSEQDFEAAAQAEEVGQKILTNLNQFYQLKEHHYRCSASIGAIIFNENDITADELLKQADIAMYQAKNSGRNALRFFDPNMQLSIDARVELEANLREALSAHQFSLYFQAQVNDLKQIIGAEVLIRWQHPTLGFISPMDFIPLAETTGLILPIGRWVLETACAQLQLWGMDVRTEPLQLAVNISIRQFYEADFVAQVRQLLEHTHINPARLKLELTESLVFNDLDDARHKMHELRQLGVGFSMDDFGTGYSSLSNLKHLPFDQLKIDQSFINDLGIDNDNAIIVKTIIVMAKSMNMEVIAEGVETEEQRQFLSKHDCQLYQGYLFSKPLPIEQFALLL